MAVTEFNLASKIELMPIRGLSFWNSVTDVKNFYYLGNGSTWQITPVTRKASTGMERIIGWKYEGEFVFLQNKDIKEVVSHLSEISARQQPYDGTLNPEITYDMAVLLGNANPQSGSNPPPKHIYNYTDNLWIDLNRNSNIVFSLAQTGLNPVTTINVLGYTKNINNWIT